MVDDQRITFDRVDYAADLRARHTQNPADNTQLRDTRLVNLFLQFFSRIAVDREA
jgi:hypothetical protein